MGLGGSTGARRQRWVALVAVAVVSVAGPVLALAAPADAAPRDRYVSVTGSDDADGRSPATAWRTLQKAAGAAPVAAVVHVAAGDYEPFVITQRQAFVADAGDPVVVHGAPGVQDVVRVSAAQVRIQGLTVTGCVPEPAPSEGFEHNGSSGIRVDEGADRVVLQSVTVRDSHGTNSHGLPFGCYGVFVHGADYTRILDSDISGNGAGVYFNGGGQGAQVLRNTIHDNDVIIRNTPGNNDDFGGGAVALTNLDSEPGPLVRDNVITGNAGPSSDYEDDGGAIEIYNASHVRVVHNTLSNNENILETGTGPGGRCADNRFVSNTVTGRTPGSTLSKSIGIILRCAQGMVISGNSFTEIDWWVYTIDTGDQFSSGVDGLTIVNNTLTQWQKVYHLAVDPVANHVTVDRNRFHFTGPIFSSYDDATTGPGLDAWRLRSGLDRRSTVF